MRKPYKYWQNKENCKNEALKHQTISSFSKYSAHGYNVARVNEWLDEICQHMTKNGNWYNRCVYVYEFLDNYAYVGLTYNIQERNNNHINGGKKITSVNKHIIETGLIPKLIKLTEYIPVEKAIILEKKYLQQYKINGWKILNEIKTGGTGGKPKTWNFENCKKEALKYKTRNDFRVNSSGAYDAAYKNKWIDEICIHMITKWKKSGYWNFENCLEETFKYSKKIDFARKSSGAYDAAWKNNWLNNIYSIVGL